MILSRLVLNLRKIAICNRRQLINGKSMISTHKQCEIPSVTPWQRYLSTKSPNSETCPDKTVATESQVSEKFEDEERETEKRESQASREPLELKTENTSMYLSRIEQKLRDGKVKAAIAIVEKDMIMKDRIKPDEYIFSLLMNECGQFGFAKKCFQLYKLMKTCGFEPTEENYTALLNSCLNTPFLNDGLIFVRRISNVFKSTKYQPTLEQYELLMQVFARCGDFEMALSLVHTAKKANIQLNLNTFKMLLHIASEDTKNGFRHAVIIWHMLYKRDYAPDIFSFHLLLKCVSDCGIGDVETARKEFEDIIRRSKSDLRDSQPPSSVDQSLADAVTHNTDVEELDHRPNLLSRKPCLGKLLPLEEVVHPGDRLLLLGGLKNVMQEIDNCKVIPTMGTFLQLLLAIPLTTVAENKLLLFMRKAAIDPDIVFFNSMLKRRCLESSYDESLGILNMIHKSDLIPDMETFVLLAISCKSMDEMTHLLDGMNSSDVRPNIYIFEAFVRNACQQNSIDDIEEILNMVKSAELSVKDSFFSILNQFCIDYPKNNLIGKYPSKYKVIEFERFSRRYRRWRKEALLNSKLDQIEETPSGCEEKAEPEKSVHQQKCNTKKVHNAGSVEKRENGEDDKVRVHPWETFRKNVIPEGVDVTPGQSLKNKKRRKRRSRYGMNASEQSDNHNFADELMSTRPKKKPHMKRQPPPPKMSNEKK